MTELRGQIRGAAARKYAEFCWRQPVMVPIDHWSVDPDRFNWMHEYPRYVNPPHSPQLPTVNLADYAIRTSRTSAGLDIQVWMLPTPHTAARQPLLVWQAQVHDGCEPECYGVALAMAFR